MTGTRYVCVQGSTPGGRPPWSAASAAPGSSCGRPASEGRSNNQAPKAQATYDAIIVGGGVAGLSVAAALSPHMRVCLVEREPTLASHASGRNAAIFRPLESDDTTPALCERSLQLLTALTDRPVVSGHGLILALGADEAAAREAQRAVQQGVPHALLHRAELWERAPVLRGGAVTAGLFLPHGGVLDIHEITSSLARAARGAGARIQTGAEVRGVDVSTGRVAGVRLADGERLRCQHLIIAGGAWAAAVGELAGAPLPLRPVRRHLVQLAFVGQRAAPTWPVVWRVDEQIYFRPEGTGVLASPCDETPWSTPVPVGQPANDPAALESLALRLARTAPLLANMVVQKPWACFRTFAPDRELVVGPDPRVDGLHWLSGLGGRGMGVGPAAGELVAQRILGRVTRIGEPFAVERLLRV